jgi:hypothetical protein
MRVYSAKEMRMARNYSQAVQSQNTLAVIVSNSQWFRSNSVVERPYAWKRMQNIEDEGLVLQ